MNFRKLIFSQNYPDIGLLILRVTAGGYMLLAHGVSKMSNFSQLSKAFPDPLGVGHTLSLVLAGGAEFFCSIAIILGLFTRFASLPLIATMFVAAFIVHSGDPFAKRELALLYFSCYTAIFFMGPGKFSIDEKIR